MSPFQMGGLRRQIPLFSGESACWSALSRHMTGPCLLRLCFPVWSVRCKRTVCPNVMRSARQMGNGLPHPSSFFSFFGGQDRIFTDICRSIEGNGWSVCLGPPEKLTGVIGSIQTIGKSRVNRGMTYRWAAALLIFQSVGRVVFPNKVLLLLENVQDMFDV